MSYGDRERKKYMKNNYWERKNLFNQFFSQWINFSYESFLNFWEYKKK